MLIKHDSEDKLEKGAPTPGTKTPFNAPSISSKVISSGKEISGKSGKRVYGPRGFIDEKTTGFY